MIIIYGVICLCVFHAIITDIIYRRIYNFISIYIILLSFMLHFFSNFKLSIIAPLIVLLIGFFLFVRHIWGAGDAKLCFALSCSLPAELVFMFVFLMSMSGGVIAIFMVVFPQLKGKFTSVPYGLAIGTGYLLTLVVGISNASIVFS
ncbi:prepilin peptidase [Salmonella enterica]